MREDVEKENIVQLVDEDGNTVEFEHLLTYEYGDRFYVALLPVEEFEDMEEGEVLLMRLEEEDDADLFMPIETEEELNGAWEAFMQVYYEEEEDGCGCGCEDCQGCDHDHEEE